jgi:uncharacterized membrane protein
MKNNVLKIAYGGILSAVIMLATWAITVPIPNTAGYINLGDGVIFGISVILGPFAAICAALGSALADLAYAAPIYMPATFVIKGLMGLLAGITLKKYPKLPWFWQILLFAGCELIMIAGYFAYESIINPGFALGTLPGNSMQGIAGIVLGIALVPLARRLKAILKL